MHRINVFLLAAAGALLLQVHGKAATPDGKGFPSADAAAQALVSAATSDDVANLIEILGPSAKSIVVTRDPVADRKVRRDFAALAGQKIRLAPSRGKQNAKTLLAGKNEWPFPIPIVQWNGQWYFDTTQGKQEILTRRIGRNELAAIQVCLAIVDAEREFATLDLDGDGVPEYAPKFVSAPGKRDGLYWPIKADERLSPLGPLLAAATKEGYPRSGSRTLAPYHGYFYRILTRQGKDAAGGAYDYFVKGKMIGGFAVIAYPARYGASGVMSFIVNHDAMVYERDLGKNTTALASKMTTYNPDASWKRP